MIVMNNMYGAISDGLTDHSNARWKDTNEWDSKFGHAGVIPLGIIG